MSTVSASGVKKVKYTTLKTAHNDVANVHNRSVRANFCLGLGGINDCLVAERGGLGDRLGDPLSLSAAS